MLATRNPHKLREFAGLLAPHDVLPLPEYVELPPETGDTFEENAVEKARAAARATGRTAIADDSGIAAAALGGRPGVRSARYAGESATDEENLAKLLREVPDDLPGGRTMAELDPAEKDAISHRGRAVRMLSGWLTAERS